MCGCNQNSLFGNRTVGSPALGGNWLQVLAAAAFIYSCTTAGLRLGAGSWLFE